MTSAVVWPLRLTLSPCCAKTDDHSKPRLGAPNVLQAPRWKYVCQQPAKLSDNYANQPADHAPQKQSHFSHRRSTGIGLDCALAYAREGARGVIVAGEGSAAAAVVSSLGDGLLGFACEVAQDDQVKNPSNAPSPLTAI